MKNESLKTQFAPAERYPIKEIKSQFKILNNNKLLANLIDSVSQMLVILNPKRQIVFTNKFFRNFLDIEDEKSIFGSRIGEALNCIHANNATGGCGTTEFCSKCGAVKAILESQKGLQSTKECRISISDSDALDLRVTATPFLYDETEYTIFVINDISHEKRRQTLERFFFHDVLNSAGGISGLSGIMKDIKDPDEIAEISQMINRSAENLIEEIQSQRQLSAAERGDLDLNITESSSLTQLKYIAELYSKHETTNGKIIKIDQTAEDFLFKTDMVLFRRIVGNMLKNALEATYVGSTVTLSSGKNQNQFNFSVHNNSYIDHSIQLQLFKRSFSTKGIGRGIGTYSMKLLGEKYLNGKVWFESNKEKGTTFFLAL